MTEVQRIILRELRMRGSLEQHSWCLPARSTYSLRIMQERGLVSQSIGSEKWSITSAGRRALEEEPR